MPISTSQQDKINTTAHLIETTGHHLAHTKRHSVALRNSTTKAERDFNHDHLDTHLNGAIEHVQKIMDHMKTNYPAIGKELDTLEATIPMSERERVLKKASTIGQGKNI